ncbi:MAG: hypothetical protein QOE77_2448 [Blastocatellia bacterium]|jgi:hypothetical protein|nr:hypothetical protein [Blastocatellia bacterium]
MILKQRTISLSLIIVLAFASIMVALRYVHGETSASGKGMKVKVLRRKDQLHVKPTAAEIADPRSRIQDAAATPKEERELGDQIPKHLPIRIRIKQEKEEAFKDLKNDKWLRDFELEVKNVGDKPIYFLSLIFTMPEVKTPDGNDYGFSLHYGRGDLLDFSNSLKPEDTPLKVGDTYVFRIGKNLVEGWEHFRTQNKAMLRPKKALIRFNLVNFGDGTGFMGTTGVPIPNRPQTQSNQTLFQRNIDYYYAFCYIKARL